MPSQEFFIQLFGVCLLVLISGSILFLKRLFSAEKKFEEKEAKTIKNYKDILFQAHKDAEEIITNAITAETHIRQDSLEMQQQLIDEARNTAQQTITTLASRFEKHALTLEEASQKQMQDVFSHLEKTAEQRVKEFIDTFSQQTTGLQIKLSLRMKEAMEQTEKDLEHYKEEQMKKITDEVNILVMKVSSDVLDRTITPSEQQSLLLDALENAKKEGLLLHGAS